MQIYRGNLNCFHLLNPVIVYLKLFLVYDLSSLDTPRVDRLSA